MQLAMFGDEVDCNQKREMIKIISIHSFQPDPTS